MKMPLSNRNVIIAIDDSENAEYAFDCEFLNLILYLILFNYLVL